MHHDSRSVFCQSKIAERETQQHDHEETSFKQVQTTKMLVTRNNVSDINIPRIFYIVNYRDNHLVMNGIQIISKGAVLNCDKHWTILHHS